MASHQRENEFRQACWSGHLAEVRRALDDHGVDINVREKFAGVTGLHMAAEGMQASIVSFLIERGCDINAENNDGENALITVLKERPPERGELVDEKARHEIVDLLLKNGISLKSKAFGELGSKPIHLAAQLGDLSLIEQLVRHSSSSSSGSSVSSSSSIRIFDSKGRSPLHYAASKGHILAMQVCCEFDESLLHSADFDGYLPMHLACEEVQIESVEFLLDRGSLMNVLSVNGDLPIHLVARRKSELVQPIVEFLISLGADVDTPDSRGFNVRRYCKENASLGNSIANGRALAKKHGRRRLEPTTKAVLSSSSDLPMIEEDELKADVIDEGPIPTSSSVFDDAPPYDSLAGDGAAGSSSSSSSISSGLISSSSSGLWAGLFGASTAAMIADSASKPKHPVVFTKGEAAEGLAVLQLKGVHLFSGSGTYETLNSQTKETISKSKSGTIEVFQYGLQFAWKSGFLGRTSNEKFVVWKPATRLISEKHGKSLLIVISDEDPSPEEGSGAGTEGTSSSSSGETGYRYASSASVYAAAEEGDAETGGSGSVVSTSSSDASGVSSAGPTIEDAFRVGCKASELSEMIQHQIDKMFPQYSAQLGCHSEIVYWRVEKKRVCFTIDCIDRRKLRAFLDKFGGHSGIAERLSVFKRFIKDGGTVDSAPETVRKVISEVKDCWYSAAELILELDMSADGLRQRLSEMVDSGEHWKSISLARSGLFDLEQWRRVLLSIRIECLPTMASVLGLATDPSAKAHLNPDPQLAS